MATEVGVGYISIAPEIKGFAAELERGTDSAATKAGNSAEKKFSTAFGSPDIKGFGSKLQSETEQAATRAGNSAERKFSTAFGSPDVKGFGSKLQNETDQAATKAGRSGAKHFSSGFGAVGGMLAGIGLTSFLSKATDEAEDAAQSTGKLAVAAERVGLSDGIEKLGEDADNLGKRLAIDNDEIAKVQTKIAAFDLARSLNTSGGEAVGVIDKITTASYDLAAQGFGSAESAAVKLTRAVVDPSKATALLKLGVITQEQIDQAKELQKAGDLEGAQAIILTEIFKKNGDAAAANATDSQKLAVTWDNVAEKIGTGLLPLLSIFADVLNTIPVPVLVAGVIALGAAVGVALVAPLFAATAAVWGFTAALLANPITWVILAIIALIAAIVLLWQNWDTVKNALSVAWDWIKEKFLAFVDVIKTQWSQMWESIKNVLATVWAGIQGTIGGAIEKVKGVIQGALSIVQSIWDNTFGRIWDITKKVAAGIGAAIEKAKSIVIGAVEAIKGALASVKDAVGGVPVIGGVLSAMVPSFAAGGVIPGDGLINAHGGEFMLNKQMVDRFGGLGGLESMRQGGPAPGGGGGITIENLNMINPQAETASDSLPRAMRQLQYVGVN